MGAPEKRKMRIIFTLDFWLHVFLQSIIFNLRYLPLKQAVRLPILVRKPKLNRLKGEVRIDAEKISFGMIKLGWHYSNAWADNGISWYNEGRVVFKGTAKIGGDTYFLIQKNGNVVFGDDFRAAAAIKVISACGITFGKEVRVGWNSIIMDTNCHPLYDIEKQRYTKSHGQIVIGDNNWFGTGCLVMHSVETPHRAIFAARAVVSRSGNKIMEPFCVHGGEPLRVLKRNVQRREDQEQIDYSIEEI